MPEGYVARAVRAVIGGQHEPTTEEYVNGLKAIVEGRNPHP